MRRHVALKALDPHPLEGQRLLGALSPVTLDADRSLGSLRSCRRGGNCRTTIRVGLLSAGFGDPAVDLHRVRALTFGGNGSLSGIRASLRRLGTLPQRLGLTRMGLANGCQESVEGSAVRGSVRRLSLARDLRPTRRTVLRSVQRCDGYQDQHMALVVRLPSPAMPAHQLGRRGAADAPQVGQFGKADPAGRRVVHRPG